MQAGGPQARLRAPAPPQPRDCPAWAEEAQEWTVCSSSAGYQSAAQVYASFHASRTPATQREPPAPPSEQPMPPIDATSAVVGSPAVPLRERLPPAGLSDPRAESAQAWCASPSPADAPPVGQGFEGLVQGIVSRSAASSPSSARSFLNATCARNRTVAAGTSSSSATSRYFSPW